MRRTIRTYVVPLALVVAVGGAPAVRASDNVSAFASDGRELFVGSVVSEGARSGDVCSFADSAVRLVAEGRASLVLRVEDDCRLVVDSLGTESIPGGGTADAQSVDRPKVDQPSGATDAQPSGLGGVGGKLGREVALAEQAAELAADVAADAASIERIDVLVTQWIRDAFGKTQYEDHVEARYTRNTRKKTVGNLVKTGGHCRGPLIGTVLAPVDTAPDSCYFRRLYNGPTRVVFISGGYYATRVGVITVDERRMYEAFEARYSGMYYAMCDAGGALPLGWTSSCSFEEV